METTECGSQLTFWKIDQQQVTVDFEGERSQLLYAIARKIWQV
jgi:hypothetical protein